ncbi:LOW QUALITY PROTEIN: synaptogyrin-3a [Xiphias gladius]|uniref:LOW QUALITY PROTEIN: synaptogyrin-3a n=1 Tax=Xiphias gladius TaxID=8245 RepID=UPI001A98647D|nr:LOW QUALITY PROTEIN: synaptogyrin-3a [Xiphias gladius]
MHSFVGKPVVFNLRPLSQRSRARSVLHAPPPPHRFAVPARHWVRAGPVPTAAESSASILPWSRERGAARSAQRERQNMDGVGSFGAGRAGSTIDPITFAKQPQTILRVLSWIFSLVVFASIVNEGYVNIGSERLYCVFNKNADACNYGVFVGLVGLLACSFFFLLDYKFSSISSVKDRKKAVMLEIGFSGEEATVCSRIY